MGSVLYAGGIRTSTRQNAIVPLVLTIRSTLARMTDDLYIRCRDRTGGLLGADVPPHNETFCADVSAAYYTMSIRHGCCLLGAALMSLLRRRVLFAIRVKSF